MIAYKLLKLRKDGTLGPLFINSSQVIPVGKWMRAEEHRTAGYKFRPGWHTCKETKAPHLTMKGRVWCEVEISNYIELQRPESQGTTWILADKMKVVKTLDVCHDNPFSKEA